jgi:iron complex outermembrane receptor protein
VFAQAELGSWQLRFDAGQREKKLRSMNAGFPFDYDVDAQQLRAARRERVGLRLGEEHPGAGQRLQRLARERAGRLRLGGHQQTRGWYAKDDVVLQGGTRSRWARARAHREGRELLGHRARGPPERLGAGVSHPFGAGWTGYARAGRSFRLANVDEFSFTQPGVILQPQVSRDTGTRRALGLRRRQPRRRGCTAAR